MFSPLEQFNSIIIFKLFHFSMVVNYIEYLFCVKFGFVFDFSFFNLIIPLILVRFFFSFFLMYYNYYDVYYLIPKAFFQRFFELQIIFIFNLIKQQLGLNYYSYIIFIFSIFYGILLLNLLSLLPLGIALTSHIELMLFLSLSLGLGIFLLGLEKKGLNFFWIFIPTCPIFMIPFLMFIEIFSYIIRTFSLAIRLSANIMAGHTLVYIISTFLLKIIFSNYIFFLIGLIFLSAIWVLELGVAFLQAYVFTILVLIYINDSLKSSHH